MWDRILTLVILVFVYLVDNGGNRWRGERRKGRAGGVCGKGKFTASLILLPSGHGCYPVIFMVKEKKAKFYLSL